MTNFSYRNGQLHAENISLQHIANEVDTPCYVYSQAEITTNFQRVNNAFGQRIHQVSYAVKANSNIAVLSLLNKLGSGFDVVSGGELKRALAAGACANKIFATTN